MVETSTLTPHQELVNKLGTGHPQKQVLLILKKLEALEEIVRCQPEPEIVEVNQFVPPVPEVPKNKGGRPKGSKNKK